MFDFCLCVIGGEEWKLGAKAARGSGRGVTKH